MSNTPAPLAIGLVGGGDPEGGACAPCPSAAYWKKKKKEIKKEGRGCLKEEKATSKLAVWSAAGVHVHVVPVPVTGCVPPAL